ncbi:hypothetical protein IQ233_06355 [Nodularia sp. LEGE 06071]|nr:hypothetical protein [Nodularia sp. LEGE 06071]MBE9198735.1 hypothetical protein [Nodularia sp. LEGE 06071]
MRLFTIHPSTSSHNYSPIDGICLTLLDKVPCLTIGSYGWCGSAQQVKDPSVHILPISIKESTKKKIEAEINIEDCGQMIYPLSQCLIKYASLHESSQGYYFLKEEDDSTDQDLLVSLELPLYAAQPYYEFEGNVDIILCAYATYYNECFEIEKENALCSAIIKMRDGAKLLFRYTNREGQGKDIKKLMGQQFRFICSGGELLSLSDYKFQDFKLS